MIGSFVIDGKLYDRCLSYEGRYSRYLNRTPKTDSSPFENIISNKLKEVSSDVY